MASFIGSKIRLTANDGVFEGVLTALDPHNSRLTLGKVKSCSSNKRFGGVMHFFGNEVLKLDIIESKTKKPNREVVGEDEEVGPKLVRKRRSTPEHLKLMKQVDWDEMFPGQSKSKGNNNTESASSPKSPLMMRRASFGQQSESEGESDDAFGGRQPLFRQVADPHPATFTLLDKVNQELHQAMEHIKKQSFIGLAAEGVNMGRNGQLCWLQVATHSHILLFDVLALKEEVFKAGMSEVLENGDIQKIIHDCRFLSDLVYHQYDTKLVNVFDTQVADVMVYRIEYGGDLPSYVHSLAPTLLNHIPDFPHEKLYIQRNREALSHQDQSIWTVRPASDDQLDAAAKNVIHLRNMRRILLEKMLVDFVDGVDIYLGTVRDLSENLYDSTKPESHKLPFEFGNLRLSANTIRRHSHRNPVLYDKNGFRENCIGVKDPLLNFAHSGIWHAGSGKVQQHFSETRRGYTRDSSRRANSRSNSRGRKTTSGDDTGEESIMALGAAVIKKNAETAAKEAAVKTTRQSTAGVPRDYSSDEAVISRSKRNSPVAEKVAKPSPRRSPEKEERMPTVPERSNPSNSSSDSVLRSPVLDSNLPDNLILRAAGSESTPCLGTESQRARVSPHIGSGKPEPTRVLDNVDIIPSREDFGACTPYLSRLPKCAVTSPQTESPVHKPKPQPTLENMDRSPQSPVFSSPPAVSRTDAPDPPLRGVGRGARLLEILQAEPVSESYKTDRVNNGRIERHQFSDSDSDHSSMKGVVATSAKKVGIGRASLLLQKSAE